MELNSTMTNSSKMTNSETDSPSRTHYESGIPGNAVVTPYDPDEIPVACDAMAYYIEVVLSTCVSVDPVGRQSSSNNVIPDDVYAIAVPATSNDAAVNFASVAAVAAQPSFQRRGRFLVWPASFGSSLNPPIASRF